MREGPLRKHLASSRLTHLKFLLFAVVFMHK